MLERKQTYEEFIKSIRDSRCNIWFEHAERHHIIPRCIGGTDNVDNLIYLTPREHFIAHRLLAIENPQEKGLLYAWHLMCIDGRHDTTPEEYEEQKISWVAYLKTLHRPQSIETRQKLSQNMIGNTRGSKPRSQETKDRISKSKTGPNNPMYGKSPSVETRLKISQSLKMSGGHPHTEETKRLIGEKSAARRFKKHCTLCDRDFEARSNRTKYCYECRPQWVERNKLNFQKEGIPSP